MEFHPQKCSSMCISRAQIARTFQCHLKGAFIATEQSSKYLYLGVNLQSNFSWKIHMSRITKKSNNMLHMKVSCDAIYYKQAKKPRLRLISPWVGQTWTTVLQSGVHTNETRNTRLKWSRDDLHVLSPIDTGTPAVSHAISVRSRMKQEEVHCS